jgi:hypothetical protein
MENCLWNKKEQTEIFLCVALSYGGGSVSSVFTTLSQFEQWANIRYFCRLRSLSVEMLVSLCAICGVKLLKNPLCIANVSCLKIGFIHCKMRNAAVGQLRQ